MGNFGFEWSFALILILILPLFRYLERHFAEQRQVKGAKFSRIELLEKAMLDTPDYKRKYFMILFVFAVTAGVLAVARPYISIQIPVNPVRLMLVFDTSISMEADDMPPNRLTAAKDTAVEFIKKSPKNIKIGLEYFYGSSQVVMSPNEDHSKILSSLSELTIKDLNPGTAIGSAIDAAVNALAIGGEKDNRLVIILLTDGESNQGISPLSTAKIAAKEGITVYTVGIGSEKGAYVSGGYLTALDEGTLLEIANITGGKYFRAKTKNDFRNIYKELKTEAFSLEEQKTEITAIFSLISLFLFLFTVYFGISVFRPLF
ncbi:MAG TPA: VWA domain-containing protein [Candidatus Gastranaerophilales bacterium]|nr:VWA domain-containing protein [Candidatus Gastranaerophilales bacterium]